MYSDDQLEAAAAAGVIDAETLARLKAFCGARPGAPIVDEEHFRLVTGFNDIFVSIACVLTLVAVGWIAGDLAGPGGAPWVVGALVAATSWGLAETFTRRRRMALPSILLLAAFAGGLFEAGAVLTGTLLGVSHLIGGDLARSTQGVSPIDGSLMVAGGGLAAAIGSAAHWSRFHVPITIAAGLGAAIAVVLALLTAAVPWLGAHLALPMFVAGLAAFAVAMRWDMSDPARTTRRSDVAFWLHLLAAPLIVHPIFMSGILDGGVTPLGGCAVIAIYLGLAVIALAIDRRALMVSALAYVLYALSALFRAFGAVTLNAALTALVLGSALLLLSAYWTAVRHSVVRLLPAALRMRLPRIAEAGLNPRSA